MFDVGMLENSCRRAAFCRDRIHAGRVAINNGFAVRTPILSSESAPEFSDHRWCSAFNRYSHQIITGYKSTGYVSDGLIIRRPECLIDTSCTRDETRLLLIKIANPELAAFVFDIGDVFSIA